MVVVAALVATLTTAAFGQSTTRGISADARHIVRMLKIQQQIEFLTPKLSPVFAQQMIVTLATSERFKAQLAATDGRVRLQKALQEEFERAFQGRVGDLVDEIARDYDRRLSAADLHDVAVFLESGAGGRWAAVLSDVQQTSSTAGARAGAIAGEEVYDAVLKRLDTRTGLLK